MTAPTAQDASANQDPAKHDNRLKRLQFRSWHRGFKEADLMMGHFADKHLRELTPAQLDRYEALLAEEDHDLYGWIVGRAPVPAEHDNDVFALIRTFRHLEDSMWPQVRG